MDGNIAQQEPSADCNLLENARFYCTHSGKNKTPSVHRYGLVRVAEGGFFNVHGEYLQIHSSHAQYGALALNSLIIGRNINVRSARIPEVKIEGCEIGGNVDAEGAKVQAVYLYRTSIGGDLYLRNLNRDPTKDGRFPNDSRVSISSGGEIKGDADFTSGNFGEVFLCGHIDGRIILEDAVAKGFTADMDEAKTLYGRNFRCPIVELRYGHGYAADFTNGNFAEVKLTGDHAFSPDGNQPVSISRLELPNARIGDALLVDNHEIEYINMAGAVVSVIHLTNVIIREASVDGLRVRGFVSHGKVELPENLESVLASAKQRE